MGIVSAFDALSFLFFVFHIPVSLLVDGQLVFPREFFPHWAVQILEDYIRDTKDPNMSGGEDWFHSLIFMEIICQVPFFIFAIFCYIRRHSIVRIPAILYSAHTCTALIPILVSLIAPYAQGKEIEYDVGRLIMTYVPFFIIPFLIGARWLLYDDPPFPKPQQQNRKEKDV